MSLVAIVVPFYSNKGWLIDALRSIEAQTFVDYSVIVVNDGSQENLADLDSFFSKPNWTLVEQKNQGPAAARNKGIELARAKYIAFLDSDDLWPSDKLEKQINLMERQGLEWTQHSYNKFWASGIEKFVDTSDCVGIVTGRIFSSFRVQTSTVVVSSSLLKSHKVIFPKDYRYGQDIAFFLALSVYAELQHIDGVVGKFRMRRGNAGFDAIVQLNARARVWRDYQATDTYRGAISVPAKIGYLLCTFYTHQFLRGYQNSAETTFQKYIAQVFYILPYFFFKLAARIERARNRAS